MKSISNETVELHLTRARKADIDDYFEGRKAGDYWCIVNLRVNKKYRRKGIGAALVRIAIAEACEAGKGLICQAYPFEEGQKYGMTSPSTVSRQKALIRFYSRFGFKHSAGGWMILEKQQ